MRLSNLFNCLAIIATFDSCYCAITINKAGSRTNNPWVFNVPQAFAYLPVKSDKYLGICTSNLIEYPQYCKAAFSRISRRHGKDYFTSIKRLPGHLNLGNYIVIIGNNTSCMQTEMYSAKIGATSKPGLLEKNITKKMACRSDKLVTKITLSREYTHAGGIDMSGAYLVVPLSKENSSCILFFDMSNPEKPEELAISIKRNDSNAHAAALTQLIDDHFLLAVVTDGAGKSNRGFDFYYSKGTNILEGFDPNSVIHVSKKSFFNYAHKCTYKTINFVNDYCESLYLVGTFNSPVENPFNVGEDFAHLFEIQMRTVTQAIIDKAKNIDPHCTTATLHVGDKKPYVSFLQEKHMFCRHSYCSFSAGGSLYIPDQQHMYLYSIAQWLTDDGASLYFVQYGSIKNIPLMNLKAICTIAL